MGQSGYLLKKKKQPGCKHARVLVLLLFIVILIMSFLSLAFLKQKEVTSIVGTWVSEETGVVLTFTEEGKVTFKDDLSEAIYRIISPNTMEYTVDNMSFQMIYTIQDGKLHWGVDKEQMETFSFK